VDNTALTSSGRCVPQKGRPGGLLAGVDDALGSVAGTNLQVLARQRNFSCGVG
jgi:hypothetical protein